MKCCMVACISIYSNCKIGLQQCWRSSAGEADGSAVSSTKYPEHRKISHITFSECVNNLTLINQNLSVNVTGIHKRLLIA